MVVVYRQGVWGRLGSDEGWEGGIKTWNEESLGGIDIFIILILGLHGDIHMSKLLRIYVLITNPCFILFSTKYFFKIK